MRTPDFYRVQSTTPSLQFLYARITDLLRPQAACPWLATPFRPFFRYFVRLVTLFWRAGPIMRAVQIPRTKKPRTP